MKQASLLLLITALNFFATTAFAQTVEKVQGSAAIINGGEMQLAMDDEFFTVDAAGHKTAIVKVRQLKNNRAVATIVKGNVEAGQTLLKRNSAAAKSNKSSGKQSAADSGPGKKFKSAAGFVLGMSMDSIAFPASNAALTYTESASMSGSSFVAKGFYDHPLSDSFNFRFLGGLDGFAGTYAAKNPVINNPATANSTLALQTIALDGEIQWNLYHKGLTSFWLGGGYSFQYAMSVSSNLVSLQTSSSYSNSIFVGLGSNIKMGYSSFLPIYVHYNDYIAGSGITQSSITVAVGWGWAY